MHIQRSTLTTSGLMSNWKFDTTEGFMQDRFSQTSQWDRYRKSYVRNRQIRIMADNQHTIGDGESERRERAHCLLVLPQKSRTQLHIATYWIFTIQKLVRKQMLICYHLATVSWLYVSTFCVLVRVLFVYFIFLYCFYCSSQSSVCDWHAI